jgi:copper(I)-binding protein
MKSLKTIVVSLMLSATLASPSYSHDDCASGDAAHGTVEAKAKQHAHLELSHARTRAMLAGQKVGGGYITIKNTSDQDDRLIGASSDRAGRMEIHEMSMSDGVMKMRKLEDGIVVPAGGSIELKPGGHHLMFFGVQKPFTEGETVPVEFTFEKAGKIMIDLVTTPAASAKEKKHH